MVRERLTHSTVHGPALLVRGDDLQQRGLEALQHGDVGVAELQDHLGLAGDDRGRAGLDRHLADGPHAARPASGGKLVHHSL